MIAHFLPNCPPWDNWGPTAVRHELLASGKFFQRQPLHGRPLAQGKNPPVRSARHVRTAALHGTPLVNGLRKLAFVGRPEKALPLPPLALLRATLNARGVAGRRRGRSWWKFCPRNVEFLIKSCNTPCAFPYQWAIPYDAVALSYPVCIFLGDSV